MQNNIRDLAKGLILSRLIDRTTLIRSKENSYEPIWSRSEGWYARVHIMACTHAHMITATYIYI